MNDENAVGVDDGDEALPVLQRTTTERQVSVTCGACGADVPYQGEGRPRRYCNPSCRTQAWALRRAAARLEIALPEPVREIRERVVDRWVPARPAAPDTAREWSGLLTELQDKLADRRTAVHREHWNHRHLYAALVETMAALGAAHPGGLDQFRRR
jgi:endogenous inhibitor of DNA gyrase (YacG/DUF329 family)